MESKLIDVILNRIDKLESKIDVLIAFKYRIIGGTVIASLIMTAIFQILVLASNSK